MFDDFEQNGSDDYEYVEPSDDSFVGSAPTPDDSLDVASIERSVVELNDVERSVVELQDLRSDQVIIDIGSSSNSSGISESDSDEYAIPLVAYDAYNPNNDVDNEDEETDSYSEESSYYETDENEEDESDESDEDDDDDTQLVTEEFYNEQVAIRIESTSDESISSPERNVTIENVATGGNNGDELFRLVERKMVLAQFQMPIKKPSTPNEVPFLSKKSR
jgi:hypothetical protein